MPKNLKRYYEFHHLHFITFSCYRRLPFLNTPRRRDALLRLIERVRKEHQCPILGYVIMPEHLHILIAPPKKGDPSTFMQAIKQRSSRQFRARRKNKSATLFAGLQPKSFWQPRFHGFNVFTDHKRVQKLRYMHRNPVKRGLVASPELWRWSSYRFYMLDEPGAITITKFEDLPDIARVEGQRTVMPLAPFPQILDDGGGGPTTATPRQWVPHRFSTDSPSRICGNTG